MANQFETLVAFAGSKLGFDNVKPNDRGEVVLQFPNTFISMTCPSNASMIRIVTPVAEIKGECSKEVLQRLLEAQVFFSETRGGTFSYSSTSGYVLLHLNLQLNGIDENEFANAVENMLIVSNKFAEEIDQLLAQNSNS